MDNYDRTVKVGEGTYGVVYKAVHRPTGRICAIKKIRLHSSAGAPNGAPALDDEDGVPATAIREVACLREIHERLIDSVDDSSDDGATVTPSSSADENSPATTLVDSPGSPPVWNSSKVVIVGKTVGSKGGPSRSLIGTRPEDHIVRLLDVLHTETRLQLVFEFIDCDLRRYMAHTLGSRQGRRAAREAALSASLPPDMRVQDELGFGLGIAVDGQSLDTGLVEWEGRGLPLDQVKSLTYQLTLGLCHLHSRRIFHRDLKPQNLLISPRGAPDGGPLLKIADFGLARTVGIPIRTYTHEIITLYYRPPEVLLGTRHYTSAVDMWSVGCILAEMATGAPLFTGDSELGQLMKIFQTLGTPDETCWPGVDELPDYKPTFPQFRMRDFTCAAPELCARGLDLLAGCLVYDPVRRVSAKDALTMPYLRFGRKLVRKVVRVVKQAKPKLGASLTPMSASSPAPSMVGKASPAAAAMMALMNAKVSVIGAGPYPTPPMTGRPRAPSKLSQSPMTMPRSYEPSPPVAHFTTLPIPEDQTVDFFPTFPTSVTSLPPACAPALAVAEPVATGERMAISPVKISLELSPAI